MRSTGLVLVLVATLAASSVGLETWRDRNYGAAREAASFLYVPSGQAVARMGLSFDAILADVYWVRAIQHYGGTKRSAGRGKQYDLLYQLLDITTSLDPQFNIAYRFGAIFLAEAYPGGPGRPDQAVALLEKGFKARPDRWQYLQDIGFVYYWWLQDFKTAADWFEKASEVSGAPWYLRSLAAVTLTKGGGRDSSRALWRQLHDTADNDWLRRESERRLLQLDALDAIDALHDVVRAYATRTGRLPATWEALVGARMLAGRPLDPTGTPFELDPATGSVTVSPSSRVYPLPVGARSR